MKAVSVSGSTSVARCLYLNPRKSWPVRLERGWSPVITSQPSFEQSDTASRLQDYRARLSHDAMTSRAQHGSVAAMHGATPSEKHHCRLPYLHPACKSSYASFRISRATETERGWLRCMSSTPSLVSEPERDSVTCRTDCRLAKCGGRCRSEWRFP